MNDKMTGAELRVQLTGLGLTAVWFANRLRITTRTVFRWFDLDEVPTKAVAEINRISQITADEMGRVVTAMRADGVLRTLRIDPDATGVQKLNTLPAAWHQALVFRALQYLRSTGVEVVVGYLPTIGNRAAG